MKRGRNEKGSEVERKEKKNREREGIHRKTREISGRSKGHINRLPFSLPLNKPTLWKIEIRSLNHLGPFSKVCNFYDRSPP